MGRANIVLAASGRPRKITRQVEEEIVQKTTGEDPAPEESTHWTSRLMGKALRIVHVTIWRVRRKYGLKPHPDLEIHVILDNYATHKHEKVRNWLARNPRVHFHFVPTGGSWANIVERLFGELDERQLKRVAVNSVSHSFTPSTPIWIIGMRIRLPSSGLSRYSCMLV